MIGPSPLANSRSKPIGSRIRRISANSMAASTPRISAAVTVTSVARSGRLQSSRNGTFERIARYSAMYRPACLINQIGVTSARSRRQALRKGLFQSGLITLACCRDGRDSGMSFWLGGTRTQSQTGHILSILRPCDEFTGDRRVQQLEEGQVRPGGAALAA